MKKPSMKPVAKAAGAPKTASKPATVKASSKTDSPYAAEDKRWKTEVAMRTLMRAEELKKDKTLMKDVACLAKEQAAKLSGLVGKGK